MILYDFIGALLILVKYNLYVGKHLAVNEETVLSILNNLHHGQGYNFCTLLMNRLEADLMLLYNFLAL